MATKFLKGYGPGLKIFGGVAIATTVIVGGYFGFRTIKPNTQTPSTTTTTPKTQTQTLTKPSLNGRYAGTSSVAQGISEATVTITGSTLSGRAVYIGPFNVKISGLKIVGKATDNSIADQARGNVNGTFSGSGKVMGQTIKVNGTFTGHIINTSMNVSYSAVTSAGTYPGQISLSKQ